MTGRLTFKALTFLIIFFGGCASTRMTSFKDPDYQVTRFKRILVVANTSDLERRLYFESKMVDVLLDAGVFALEGYRLFPPTRDLSPEQKVALLVRDSIDSYLAISVGESGIEQVYIPPTGSTTTTKGTASIVGDRLNYEQKSKTTIEGGYTFSKPWAEFTVELVDVTYGRRAWIASAFTGGNAFANFNTVINSFCNETLERLAQDRLVETESEKRNNAERQLNNDRQKAEEAKAAKRKQLIEKSAIKGDVVYLKNGNIIRGTIVAQVGLEDRLERITIRTFGGETRTYEGTDIDRIQKAD